MLYFFVIWDDQHRNTNMNTKDHLVGQLTKVHPAWIHTHVSLNLNSNIPLLDYALFEVMDKFHKFVQIKNSIGHWWLTGVSVLRDAIASKKRVVFNDKSLLLCWLSSGVSFLICLPIIQKSWLQRPYHDWTLHIAPEERERKHQCARNQIFLLSPSLFYQERKIRDGFQNKSGKLVLWTNLPWTPTSPHLSLALFKPSATNV